MDRPLGLLAELTYRCPLHCPYCSNPVAVPGSAEMALPEWSRVLEQARHLGVLQLHLSGGEPLARPLNQVNVEVKIPAQYRDETVSFVSQVVPRTLPVPPLPAVP